jgi:hypothetical protein
LSNLRGSKAVFVRTAAIVRNMGKDMHDLAVDAIKTVPDEKKSSYDPPLDFIVLTGGGAEGISGP